MHGERVETHMSTEHAWYLDVRKPHTARNGGTSERVHLVVDVHADEAVRSLVA